MPNKKVNELAADSTFSGAHLVPVADPITGILFKVPVSDFQGVKKYAIAGDASYAVAANSFLKTIIVESVTDLVLIIGTTDGGDEIMIARTILADEPEVIDVNVKTNAAPKTIYLNGITGATDLILIYQIL